jgi:hypothetical protein
MFMNMFVCLSTSRTNEHWPLIGRTNEYDLTNTVRLFIGHPDLLAIIVGNKVLVGIKPLN